MGANFAPLTKRLLVEGITKHRRELWDWQFELAKRYPPPFYCSVDLRDSGHKIVPVDSNLYPAGFNNICPEDLRTAPVVFRAQIESMAPRLGVDSIKRILIIPESHTANAYYVENLYYLRQIIQNAGYETQIGWYGPLPEGSEGEVKLVSVTSKELRAHPIQVNDGVISANGFVPDFILLNNDFSSGYPKQLDNLKQPVLPSHTLGWHTRKKSTHFIHYNRLAGECARIIGVYPWLVLVDTVVVQNVNFNEQSGSEETAQAVERVLERTRKAYEKYQIDYPPFAFVKNNSGTYGMGIMVVHSADEIRRMNRRTKNKMSVGKNRLAIQSVAVQEGVKTATLVDRLAAEPVIYLAGYELIGGFLRTNTERGDEDNLNTQGMVFKKLCMSDLQRPTPGSFDTPEADEDMGQEPVLELVYGSIARISAFATGIELAERQNAL